MQKKASISPAKSSSRKKSMDPAKPLIAGIVGAAVGAGVGIAGIFAMQDPKTRAKMEKLAITLGKKTGEYLQNMKIEATHQLVDKAEEIIPEVKKIAASNR
jgi:hypothetical protein